MTRLWQMSCGKQAPLSFFIQLVTVSGWRGTLLLAVGSLAAILSGVNVAYRSTRFIPFFNAYFSWCLSTKQNSWNLSNNYSQASAPSYAGQENTTFDGVIESSSHGSYAIFTLGALMLVTSFFQFFLWEYINAVNVRKIRDIFFTQALRQDMGWHEKLGKESDLNTRLSVDLERVRNSLGSKTSMLIFSVSSILTSLAIIFRIHWIMGVITLSGTIITFTFALVAGKLLVKQVRKEQENDRKIGHAVTEVLTTFKIVKSFAREKHEVEKFSRLLKTGRGHSKIKHIICSIHSAFNICSIYSLVTVFLCVGSQLIDERAISPGLYNIGYFCVMLSSLYSGNLVPIISDVMEAAASFTNLMSLKDVVPDIDPSSDGGLRPEHLRSDIYFQDVTFAYPKRKTFKVLDGLTMRIPRGKCVALVGQSGSGKSTVIDLILRILDPDSGKVTIGDINIRTMNVNDLRKRIGIVMQEPVLFDTTIEENIRYGNLAAISADIQEAAKLVNAHDFIMKLPDGYQTMVGERGGNLSGGQKQRIAIARALVRDPDILLLDEATSALDSHSERVVQDALERAMKGRTTIIVAHRLSTISHADLIYVLRDGYVNECGTHSELMSKLGIYYSLQSQDTLQKAFREREIEKNICSSGENVPVLGGRTSSTKQKPPDESTGGNVKAELQTSLVREKQILELFLRWKSFVSFLFSMIGAANAACFCYIFYYRILQILSASVAMEDTVEHLRMGMLRQVLSRDMHFIDRTKSKVTQLANAIIQQPGQLKNIAGSKASGAVTGMTRIPVSLIACFMGFWQLTSIQCLFFILFIIVNYGQMRLKLKFQSSARDRLNKGSKLASECFDNIKAVQCLSLQKEMSESYMSILSATKEEFAQSLAYAVTYALLTGVASIFLGISLSLGFKLTGEVESSIDYMLCSTYNFQVAFTSVTALIMYYQDFGESKQAVLDSIAMARASSSTNEASFKKPKLEGGIEFEEVQFSYPSSPDCPVLRGFSLTVHPGQTVALVGSSGHGKSTVINLLEKFYVAGRGKIVIDGTDIRDINTHYLRDNMALVTQEPLLFNMTIRENILYGAKSGCEISDETLFRCCREANIYDFIMGLPERFETTVGARGSQLSGGQRQRIAIARALIRDPKILLLDEATSALDSESEKEVLDALDRVVQGRTTIVIAHRLTTIRSADLIAVVENGRVKEQGNHEELLKLKGSYCEMLQMK